MYVLTSYIYYRCVLSMFDLCCCVGASCMCVCMHLCIVSYVCVRVCTCICMCACVYMRMCVCVCVCVRERVCVYEPPGAHLWIRTPEKGSGQCKPRRALVSEVSLYRYPPSIRARGKGKFYFLNWKINNLRYILFAQKAVLIFFYAWTGDFFISSSESTKVLFKIVKCTTWLFSINNLSSLN